MGEEGRRGSGEETALEHVQRERRRIRPVDGEPAAKEMRKMRKQKEKKDMAVVNDAFLSTDLQADELSGQGLKYKFVRDEVELSWSTDMEVDTLGYKVQKRA